MKYFLLLLVFPAILGQKCDKHNSGLPACVQGKIDSIKALPRGNPPAEVSEYIFNGRPVYLFTANCCDQFLLLYDGSCNYLCAPSGGLTGKGDGQCAGFYEQAKYVKRVWKDER